ncbi:cyclic nucleotide-binding domain-containing protein [Paenibacillus luteus]|uniref:cyclic nucleotide-binding domain-containing protein n=1 Tax=Paenibacillus luteus TaxID=2545753 RepID=UPI00114402A0|nr:cyclic nucleotide-binding domain-containing protein [Paenibacillus luteus]
MGTVFFLAGISEMINYTSFMAIFNSRIGTQYLPMMYLIEAILLPLEGWLLSFFSQRIAKPKFMLGLYSFFISIGLLNGIVLLIFRFAGIQWIGFYILLFLASNFVVRQQTLLMWSTAFDLCPTQQAKRVMPIFVLAAIVGGIIAGVISSTLAPLLGPELLYMLAAVLLMLGLPNFWRSIKQYLLPLTFNKSGENEVKDTVSSLYYLKQTLRSPFLLTVIGIMTLMPAVYFLIEYQYFTSAQEVFATEAELTSFYGLMVIILFCAALLLQLFATRLMDWLGASNTIFAITIIFLGCFLFVSFLVSSEMALVVVSIGYSLIYLLLYYFAEPSYQFFFKMLPIQHRDGFRYTAQGIAASAGILLGSLVSMLHSEVGISLTWQAVIGTCLAVALVMLAWGARHLYIKELVRFLEVSTDAAKDFLSEFLESMKHDRVRRSLMEQLKQSDETVQRFTLELLSSQPDHVFSKSLWEYVKLHTDERRALGIAAIHPDGWRELASETMEELLQDRNENVRAIAYRQLFATNSAAAASLDNSMEAARTDESMLVQAEAWRSMEESSVLLDDLRRMLGEGMESAVLASQIIGERKLQSLYFDVMMCLLSQTTIVKLNAVSAMGKMGGSEVVSSLMELLVGADKELRLAIEEALIEGGAAGMPELVRFISSPNDEIWRTAVSVANAIGSDQEIREIVVPSCIQRLQALSASHAVTARIEAMNKQEWTGLAKSRVEEMTAYILDTIWTIMIRFGDERSIPQLRRAVEDPDEEIRDHGLEILSEGLGNSKLDSTLLAFYRERSHTEGKGTRKQSIESFEGEVTDPWLQALAVKSGAVEGGALLMNNWEYLSALDKIVFLKQVSLFQEISIEELGRVASIAHEKIYHDGEFLIKQGEASQAIVIIIEGHVEVSGKNEDGTEGTIGILGSKQTIGEAGLFDDLPSLVSAEVLFDDARVLEIEGVEAARLVRLYPDIGIGLLRSISQRLRSLEHMLLKLG